MQMGSDFRDQLVSVQVKANSSDILLDQLSLE